jgi:predicted MPP superfamily phosphohydrolase
VRQETVPILDPGSEPIRILHLSDIHMAPWSSSTISWIGALADLEPDVVVGTGDFLGHPEGLDALTQALTPLAGVPGVVTHGSNDRYAPRFKNPLSYLWGPSSIGEKTSVPMDFEGLINLYTDQLGWVDIDNAALRLTLKGSTLDWVGVGDAHYGLDALDQVPQIVERLKEGAETAELPQHSSITTIGVTHAPYRRVLDALVTQGSEIIFAGHTHGGQVCLPGQRALTTNCDLPLDQASGLSQWRHAQRASYLEVSAGLGTSVYAPLRLFCPPEAVLVTLVGEDIGYA